MTIPTSLQLCSARSEYVPCASIQSLQVNLDRAFRFTHRYTPLIAHHATVCRSRHKPTWIVAKTGRADSSGYAQANEDRTAFNRTCSCSSLPRLPPSVLHPPVPSAPITILHFRSVAMSLGTRNSSSPDLLEVFTGSQIENRSVRNLRVHQEQRSARLQQDTSRASRNGVENAWSRKGGTRDAFVSTREEQWENTAGHVVCGGTDAGARLSCSAPRRVAARGGAPGHHRSLAFPNGKEAVAPLTAR